MTPWAHHLASRWTTAFRTPMSCFMGFGAAFMMTSIALPTDPPVKAIGDLTDVGMRSSVVAMTLLIASWFVAASGAGRSSSGRFPGFQRPFGGNETGDLPNPALPLGPAVRALMEALAGFGAMLTWLLVLVAAAPLSRSLGLDLGDSFLGYLSGTAAARGVILACCVIVPCAMAWLLPARNQAISLVRGLAVTALAAAAVVISFNSLPVVIVFATALVAALLGTARVAMIPGPFARASRRSERAVMFREPRAPLAQLWRDACLGPVAAAKWVFIISGACFALAIALVRLHVGPEMLVVFLGMVPVTVVGFMVAMYPLGTRMVARGHGGNVAPFNPDIGLAWTRLPLRREWVMRAFYAHGTIAGLAFVALNLLGVKMTGAPALFPAAVNGDTIDWIAFLCAVPPFAGFLTCRAAGDRLRGAVSIASLFLTGFGFPFMLIADRGAALALTAVLAVAGGAPPLVHLFDGRSRNTAYARPRGAQR